MLTFAGFSSRMIFAIQPGDFHRGQPVPLLDLGRCNAPGAKRLRCFVALAGRVDTDQQRSVRLDVGFLARLHHQVGRNEAIKLEAMNASSGVNGYSRLK